MAPLIQSTSPARALDAGTGSGRYLPLLASTGARLVIGVDLSLPMLARHTRLVARVCGDARRLPFADASFDLISSSLMVGDVADLDGWVSEAARVLAPGGHLVYSDFHPSWAAQGWRRTFQTVDGRSFEVGYFSHTLAEHVTVLEARSFDVRAVHEPRLTAPGPALTRLVRPLGLASTRARDAPVALVFHAVKRG
jgi:malonyl-CoA O-methyltransferase